MQKSAAAKGCPATANGRPANARAFSLYELLMTMTLIALVLTLGIPTFGSIIANHRLMVEINALFHDVHLARVGSVVRRRAVAICPTYDGLNCEADFDWSMGWMTFVNTDRDYPVARDDDEPVLSHHQVDQNALIMSNRKSFTFRSTELRTTNGTLVFCDRGGRATARALVISYTGRPRVTREDSRGESYPCLD
jgi:type IV fimbrial biogenesis protein FimT